MINDLLDVVEHAYCLVFADYLKVHLRIQNLDDCEAL